MGIKNGPYEKQAVENWLATKTEHIHLLDAIYWEQRMSNWAASIKSISNLYNIVVTPFNSRYLLSLFLSSHRKNRDKYFHKIYGTILEKMSKQLTDIPINPTKKYNQILLLKRTGIYPIYRHLFFRLRKLKF